MHFAEIDADNIVLRVIVCDTKEWCEENLGGTWVRTFYSTPGKNYAGTSYTYYPTLENFSAPQPYPSWTLDEALIWKPPIPIPSDESDQRTFYTWNEGTLSWDPVPTVV
jgi:hypothetical protein